MMRTNLMFYFLFCAGRKLSKYGFYIDIGLRHLFDGKHGGCHLPRLRHKPRWELELRGVPEGLAATRERCLPAQRARRRHHGTLVVLVAVHKELRQAAGVQLECLQASGCGVRSRHVFCCHWKFAISWTIPCCIFSCISLHDKFLDPHLMLML